MTMKPRAHSNFYPKKWVNLLKGEGGRAASLTWKQTATLHEGLLKNGFYLR